MKTTINLMEKLQSCGITLGLDENNNLLVRGDKTALDHVLINEIM